MAETIVSLVVRNLVPLLCEEVELLKGVRKDIVDVKKELECIQSFLKDADSRAERGDNNDGVRTWVKQVREEAYHIEDVIDQYMFHVAERRHQQGFVNSLRRYARKIKKVKTRHEIASDMKDIKESVRGIHERCLRYRFNSSAEGTSGGAHNVTWQHHRMAFPFTEESELFGIETPKLEMISWLEENTTNRAICSIVGMGGLGKTTLAKKVYDNQIEKGGQKGCFDCYAWINVSQSHKLEELLRTMIKKFYMAKNEIAPSPIDTMELQSLISTTREYLQQKRYMVVLDDIWELDFWKFITHVLPKNNKHSIIIITTQSDKIASSCYESSFDHIHKMQPLIPLHAWNLFCTKAFQSEFVGQCPPELEDLSHLIVERCEGLPLAVAAIGRLLSGKDKNILEWQKFHDDLATELESNEHLTNITKILSLSYSELPYNIKPCFLYMGLFPGDYSISCKRLVKLWITEGFVNGKGSKTAEDVGEEYLSELISRNLVQVASVNFAGKVKRCRVHGMMREIILLKSQELNFCQILAKEDSSIEQTTRRLSIHLTKDNAIEECGNDNIRSVFFFRMSNLSNTLLTTLFANFKLLKVFDVQYTNLDSLPKEVGTLFNMRYLSIRGTKIKELPKSIGNLRNLQTLDLKFTHVRKLPVEIKSLEKLQYLLSYYYDGQSSDRGLKIQEGIGCLEALQKLYYVEANHENGLIKELGNLRQLRKLGITKLTAEGCQALCSSIEKMSLLRSLDVCSLGEDVTIDLSSILSPPQLVQHVSLSGRMATLPDWIPMLPNLVNLSLHWTRLTDDPLRLLQPLHNLTWLWLNHAYEGEQMHFEARWFQKLKVLKLIGLNRLNRLNINEGAVPLLEELTIGPSPQLKEVPFGIQHLRNLTALQFYDMPKEFVLRMLPTEGPDFCKIERILPAVLFNRKTENEGYRCYTLSDANDIKHSYE